MNRYGRRAMHHWERHLPQRYAALTNPEQFFESLGSEIAERIMELEGDYKAPATPDYMKNLQQLNAARLQAEDEAMLELALLPAET